MKNYKEELKGAFNTYIDKIKSGNILYIGATIYSLWLIPFVHMMIDYVMYDIVWTGWENLGMLDYVFLAPGMATLIIGVPVGVIIALFNSIKSLFK